MTDMTGKTCERCKEGTYGERSIHDDWDGKVTCNKCSYRVDRHRNKQQDNDNSQHTFEI